MARELLSFPGRHGGRDALRHNGQVRQGLAGAANAPACGIHAGFSLVVACHMQWHHD